MKTHKPPPKKMGPQGYVVSEASETAYFLKPTKNSDGNDECPQCGGELSKKYIGDEVYDYCEECNEYL